jgi:tetratricopeptide (TPR) repeat protein
VGAWRGLAQIEERNKNWEPLSAILRTIVELDPNDADAKLKLGRLLLAGNVLDQAFDLINAAAQIDNRSASILAVKAAILLKLNDSSGAKREAQAALEIDPSNAEAVPFTVHIPEAERDPDLPGKLETEWPAILHWAIDGCLEWQRISRTCSNRGLPLLPKAATARVVRMSFQRRCKIVASKGAKRLGSVA